MIKFRKIYIAGHQGMVGSAIMRHFLASGHPPDRLVTRTHAELELCNQAAVRDFFAAEKPDEVYMAAALVGGIHANSAYPADFIYRNLIMEANLIDAAFQSGVKKLLFMGSSCIYPRLAPQPMTEDVLLSGPIEPTNEPYAIAKIAGIKLCESYNRQYGESHDIDYRSVMPTSLYGPGDNYHPENSHVIPALIRKFHEAKVKASSEVEIWGSGSPRREFLYVNDMAAASVYVMGLSKSVWDKYTKQMQGYINIGFGGDVAISELAIVVSNVVGYKGRINFDHTKPDGAPRKLMDIARLKNLGWSAKTSLKDGLNFSYQDFLNRCNAGLIC